MSVWAGVLWVSQVPRAFAHHISAGLSPAFTRWKEAAGACLEGTTPLPLETTFTPPGA